MARVPLATGSCGLLASVFSPIDWHEAARLLRPGGGILRLGPARMHLYELRQKLYDEARESDDKHLTDLPETLKLADTQTLEFRLGLDSFEARSDLLAMTPHGWRVNAERRERILAEPFTVTVSRALRLDPTPVTATLCPADARRAAPHRRIRKPDMRQTGYRDLPQGRRTAGGDRLAGAGHRPVQRMAARGQTQQVPRRRHPRHLAAPRPSVAGAACCWTARSRPGRTTWPAPRPPAPPSACQVRCAPAAGSEEQGEEDADRWLKVTAEGVSEITWRTD